MNRCQQDKMEGTHEEGSNHRKLTGGKTQKVVKLALLVLPIQVHD